MADDLFDNSTMTFGEHIEELRTHLWRAIKGVGIAFVIMVFVADRVVLALTWPVEDQLHKWYEDHLQRRAADFKRRLEGTPATVPMTGQLSQEQLGQLAEAITGQPLKKPPTEPMTLTIQAPIGDLLQSLVMPLAEVNRKWSLRSYSAQESFMMYFKAVFGAAIVAASPWVFYQLYSFIAVGLYAHERRLVNLTLPFSIGLFLIGVALCFFLVFPAMLKFFFSANDWLDIEPEVRLNEWVGFAVMMMIVFGVTFQMPLLMLVLERVGIISYEMLAGKRKMAVFVNFVLAAIIAPAGDPNSMLLLAVPMCILFELGLFLMRYFERRNPFAVSDPSADIETA